MAEPTRTEAIRFVLELGQALQRLGAPAHRLEESMVGAAARLGLDAQIFSTPTSVIAAFGAPPEQSTNLLRVDSGDIDIGKMAAVDHLAQGVVEGRISPARGREILRRLLAGRRPYDRALIVLGFGLVSGAAARFFGGGWPELSVSAGIGLVTGGLALALGRTAVGMRAYELLAAFLASTIAMQAARLTGGVSPEIATLAGLIVLVPGLTLTTALSELATRNLVSGSARLTAAVIVFLQIIFGVALGLRVDAALFGPLASSPPAALSATWTELVALAVAGFGLVLLFRAPLRLAPWVVGAAALSFGGARLGAQWLGPELGVAVGAFVVGVAGNAFARYRRRPALVLIVPGILLLVPGSLGFRSLNLLLRNEPLTGIATGFSTLLAGMSIVAGLLMANLLVSPRRAL